MSYQTGVPSGGGLNDLMSKLTTFLSSTVTSPWTVNDNNFATGNLSLEKDDCYVSFQNYGDESTTDYYGNSITDVRMSFHLSSGYSGAGGTPADRHITQPDSPVTTQNSVSACVVNDLDNILNYWFFASDSAPYYCHVVLETRSAHFQHFCFGNFDKKGATYTGGAFASAQYYVWWRYSAGHTGHRSIINTGTSYNGPFLGVSSSFSGQGHDNDQIYAGTASLNTLVYESEDLLLPYNSNQDGSSWSGPPELSLHYNDRVTLQEVVMIKRSIYSGEGALHTIPAGVRRSDIDRYCLLGEYPDIKLCNMEGVSDGQEITIGSDTWKFFPMRKTSDVLEIPEPPSNTIENNSHWLGVAYKKIV